MYTLLTFIATIASILLIVIVLLQSSKGGGLAGTFGGAGNMGSMFGTRRTADFLSKASWWLGGIIAVLAIVINLFFLPGQTTANQRSVVQDAGKTNIPQQPTLPQQTQFPTGDQNTNTNGQQQK
ncbi:preprotein translocase subunit SecG [bacterium BMS3Abin03]|nr:preprotein translocase subunit SecG [bacterium BMS3Abin03]HDZ59081.1 preprotein translocase subunit SecG [Ignavibacteriales bacterium]